MRAGETVIVKNVLKAMISLFFLNIKQKGFIISAHDDSRSMFNSK